MEDTNGMNPPLNSSGLLGCGDIALDRAKAVADSRGMLIVDRNHVVDSAICLEMLLQGLPQDENEMRRLSGLLAATYKVPTR